MGRLCSLRIQQSSTGKYRAGNQHPQKKAPFSLHDASSHAKSPNALGTRMI